MNSIVSFGSVTMSSREIAELVEKQHKHVIRDIRIMIQELEKDGPVLGHHEELDLRGYTSAFHLNRELTEILITGYSIPLRAAVIRRLHELEAQQAQPAIPQSLPEALRLAAEAIEERDQLALENQLKDEALAEAAPKLEALELITANNESVTITQAAKVLSIKRDTLTGWMAANGWIYRQNGSWVAYQQQIQSGRLIYKEARYTDESTGQLAYRPYCHITPKGLAKIAELMAERRIA